MTIRNHDWDNVKEIVHTDHLLSFLFFLIFLYKYRINTQSKKSYHLLIQNKQHILWQYGNQL